MSNLIKILKVAVGATTVVALIGGAAFEMRGTVAGAVHVVPEEGAPAMLARDFDFGEILPAGFCGPGRHTH